MRAQQRRDLEQHDQRARDGAENSYPARHFVIG
jgi:hypothetical protein